MAEPSPNEKIENLLEMISLNTENNDKIISSISLSSDVPSFQISSENLPKISSNSIDTTPKDSWGLSPITAVLHSLNNFSAFSEKVTNSQPKPSNIYLNPVINVVEEVNESSRMFLSPGIQDQKGFAKTPTFQAVYEDSVTWENLPEIKFGIKASKEKVIGTKTPPDFEDISNIDKQPSSEGNLSEIQVLSQMNIDKSVEYPEIVVFHDDKEKGKVDFGEMEKNFKEEKDVDDERFVKKNVEENKNAIDERCVKKGVKEKKWRSIGHMEMVLKKSEENICGGYRRKDSEKKQRIADEYKVDDLQEGYKNKKNSPRIENKKILFSTENPAFNKQSKNTAVPTISQTSFVIHSKPQPRKSVSKSQKNLKQFSKSSYPESNNSIELRQNIKSTPLLPHLKSDQKKPKLLKTLSPYSIKSSQSTLQSIFHVNRNLTSKHAAQLLTLNKHIKKRKIVLSNKNP